MARNGKANREEIVSMYLNGMSQRDIGTALTLSQTAVSYHLRKAGICAGKGQGLGEGGYVARSIPKHEYIVHEEEKQAMAVKNATNACLLVEDRSYSLKGQVGTYEVSIKTGFVVAKIGETVIELDGDKLAVLADELKALARNVAGMDVGCEMW